MLECFTYTITGLHQTYGGATLTTAYSKLYIQSHEVQLYFWVSNLKCSLGLLALPTESEGYTTLMGAPP